MEHEASSRRDAQGIADTTDCLDQWLVRGRVDLLAEIADVDVHHVAPDVGIAPNVLAQLIPRDHMARAMDHELEQGILPARELDLLGSTPHAMCGGVHLQICNLH